MGANSKRIVVRISDELETWIGQQAELEGLDPATWVRSKLMRLKNGVADTAAAPGHFRSGPNSVEVIPGVYDPTAPSIADQAAETLGQPSDAVDIDALVNEGLALADKQGLTAPQADEPEPVPHAGARPLYRPPVPFSAANQPRHLRDN